MHKTMKSDQVRTGWRDVLDYVRNGGTITVEHYNRPIARITPYTEGTMTTYAVEIEASADGEIWQAVHPVEAVHFDGTAQELADATAQEQNVADGNLWRVRVWTGSVVDLNSTPDGEHLHDETE